MFQASTTKLVVLVSIAYLPAFDTVSSIYNPVDLLNTFSDRFSNVLSILAIPASNSC